MNIKYAKKELDREYYSGPFLITEKLIAQFKNLNIAKNQSTIFDNNVSSAEICNLFMPSLHKPDIKIEFGNLVFFAGQTMDLLSDVSSGDTLTASTKLSNVYSKTGRSGKMVFIEWKIIFKNQKDEYVSKITESFVRIET